MDKLRPWALWLALGCAVLAVGTSVGASFLVTPPPLADRVSALRAPGSTLPDGISAGDLADLDAGQFSANVADPPGLGIPALAVVLGLLLLNIALAALPLLIGHRATGTIQGVVNVIAGLLGAIGGLVLALVAFLALTVMVGLFLAAPFGTIAYLAIFGWFDTRTSMFLLALVLAFLIAALVLLVVAHPRFLQSKGLIALALTALLLAVVTLVLHVLPPGILVSIADAIAAIVSGVVGLVWGVLVLIGGIVGVVKVLNVARQSVGATTTR